MHLRQSLIEVENNSLLFYINWVILLILTGRCLMKLDLFLIEVNILLAYPALKLHKPMIQYLLIIPLAGEAWNDRATSQATI